MDNRAKKLLFDVIESGRSIREWCTGRTFCEYEKDRQFRKAVEREFEVIGEALNRLAQADPATAAQIHQPAAARHVECRVRGLHRCGLDRHEDAPDELERDGSL
jgi:uncharacterized protein with HEPN domain